jgi:hypothetical protein
MGRHYEFDLNRIHTQPIAERTSKVFVSDFAKPPRAESSFRNFFDSLPKILAGTGIRDAAQAVARARQNGKPVLFAMGAHVIKCGLSTVVIDLIDRGIITSISMNGAGAIHDSEIALFGATSEDVLAGLKDGTFGMSSETASFLNGASQDAMRSGCGLGESIGRLLLESSPNDRVSILAACARKAIPATIHVGIGTDIVHMHPSADGAAYGETSLRDFRILVGCLESLNGGGALLNVGSAVILPEVILKGFAILRSAGLPLQDFTSINLDFVQQYRSGQQIVLRTSQLGARGIALTGHHEIMIPLLAHAVLDLLAS